MKIKRIGIITLSCFIVLTSILLPIQASGETLQEAYDKLAKQKKEVEKNLQEQKDTKGELSTVISQAQKMAANIEHSKQQIDILKNEIVELDQDIKKKSQELEELAVFQQMSSGENAYLEYALDTESMTEFVYRMSVIKQLMEYNSTLMKEMKEKIELNKKKTKELAEEQKSFERQKKELEVKEKELEQKQASLQATYSSLLQELEDQQRLLDDAKARGCKLDEDLSSCGAALVNNYRLLRPLAGSHYISSVYDPTGKHPSRQGLPKDWRVHTGIDIAAGKGVSVYALGYGVVTAVSRENCGGNYIWIVYKLNGKYYSSGYYHLSAQLVKVGDRVTPNTVVGRVGATGSCVAGAHLHFEMTVKARSAVADAETGTCMFGIPKGECFNYGTSKYRFDPPKVINLPGYLGWFSGR